MTDSVASSERAFKLLHTSSQRFQRWYYVASDTQHYFFPIKVIKNFHAYNNYCQLCQQWL